MKKATAIHIIPVTNKYKFSRINYKNKDSMMKYEDYEFIYGNVNEVFYNIFEHDEFLHFRESNMRREGITVKIINFGF